MIISLGFAILYVVMDLKYRNDERFPIIDLVIALIWTVFWIASSCAWAQGVTNIRLQTSFDYVSNLVGCTDTICTNYDGKLFTIDSFEDYLSFFIAGSYANIIVSVVFGFLNSCLWVGCVWFVYKETKYFRNRTAQQRPQENNFSNIQQQSQTQTPETMGQAQKTNDK